MFYYRFKCELCDRLAAVGSNRLGGGGRKCLTSHFALVGKHTAGRRCAISGEMLDSDADGIKTRNPS